MPKLKIILQSKYLYFILILITFLYVCFFNLKPIKSKYSGLEIEVEGIIDTLKLDGNKLTIELIAKEKIVINYYFNDQKELLLASQTYKIGDKVFITGSFSVPNENTVFNLFNYRNYLKSKKIYWIFKASKIEKINNSIPLKYKLKRKVEKIINDNANKEYLETFILGNSNLIDNNIKMSYQNNGISHLFAISGMHITLFSTLILFILNKLSKNEIVNYLVVILFLIFYAVLTNCTPSVIRAVLLFILCTVNKYFKINIKTIYLLILIGSMLLIYNPFYIYNLGFLFSFVITFYLIVFSDLINNSKNYFSKLLMTSLISFLASIPILINSFFTINLLSILVNIIFVGFVSYVIFPLSIITFIIPKLAFILTFFINILENLSLFLGKISFFKLTLCHISIYIVIIYYILITIVLYYFKRKKYFVILFFLLILFVHHNILFFNKNSIITMIDVGQGDSILIILPYNRGNILIDTSGIVNYYQDWQKKNQEYSIAINKIIPYMKSLGVKKINFLILSHGDFDHMGEAINLVNNFKVENVIFNNDSYNELETELIKVLENKNVKYYKDLKELNIGDNKLYFLNTNEYDNENDNSNVIYFKLNDYKFLFMGDAGIEREKDILDKYNLENIDFIKIGHHGSNTSSSEYFINSIKPKNCLISVGKNNRYGHPKESVLDILDDYCNIYRTDINGSIEIKINNNGYKIKTYI